MWRLENVKLHMWLVSVAHVVFPLVSVGPNPLSHSPYDQQRAVTASWPEPRAQLWATTGKPARPCGPRLGGLCLTTDPTVWRESARGQRDLGLNSAPLEFSCISALYPFRFP